LDKSVRDSESDAVKQFIENIIDTDGGFGELPYDVLLSFAVGLSEEYNVLPNPLDSNWEEIMELASNMLIDSPGDDY
jgi:hypothetical protein